jgi:uncharacterized membrane protein YccF (DUF307 family)
VRTILNILRLILAGFWLAIAYLFAAGFMFILAGWWLALAHVITGVLLCLTIIGIPLGIASFKMAGAALVPFGKEIVSTRSLTVQPSGSITV